MSSPLIRTLLLAGAALSLAGPAPAADIQVVDPYVRLAPPNAPATGAFMVIKNASAQPRKLVKAESNAAKTVELHTHLNVDGVMKMREVPSIAIKEHGDVALKPGSYHVMLIGMTRELKEGDRVPIKLTFDDGTAIAIEAPVQRIQAAPPATGKDHAGMKH